MVVSARLHDELAARLERLQADDLIRERQLVESNQGSYLIHKGEKKLNLASNDYLALSHHPIVNQAMSGALQTHGCGSGASQLMSGYHQLQRSLEIKLAKKTGLEQAIVFGSSYLANLGWQQALLTKQTIVFHDRLNHASLLDGSRLAGAKIKRFRHKDLDHLSSLLGSSENDANKVIVSDGVFSMEGDVADLAGLYSIAKHHQAMLVIDDAHGFGVLGEKGYGLLDQSGMEQCLPDLYISGFGKALGCYGGCVIGEPRLIDLLVQSARTLHYSTALPPAFSAGVLAAIDLLQAESWRREKLFELIRGFRLKAKQLDLELLESQTPIQSLMVGDKCTALELATGLQDCGYYVVAIRPPTVPADSSRIRISLRADHSEQELYEFLTVLKKLLSECKPR